ncbi:hypothetical protein COCNU_02G017270 [Cocos nucifera]|uniref:Uncharacterized protein n=1 Tax=Cocos nucifera TaxID=13894 RepID=A0A8K0MY51_COCNU|nr:hypothetical protein COCNU_02G017270 [Cocos nucifera]
MIYSGLDGVLICVRDEDYGELDGFFWGWEKGTEGRKKRIWLDCEHRVRYPASEVRRSSPEQTI